LATVGDNCVDRYVGTERSPTVGGNALNVAVGLVNAGYPAAYLGAVGDDADGRLIVATARAVGVDVGGVQVLSAPTGVTTVEPLPDGERVFLEERYGASELYRLDEPGFRYLRDRTWIHGANLSGAASSLGRLAADGRRLSYDFSDRALTELHAALCPHLHVAFFSAPAANDAGARAVAAGALAAGARIAVVTRGARGSIAGEAGDWFDQPALDAHPVDTLGAGDAFIAAFVAGLLEDAAVPHALRRGAEAAAETCEMIGPWPVAKEVRT
jgi:fructoselysine 6-kinase